jgi:thymidylate kinase
MGTTSLLDEVLIAFDRAEVRWALLRGRAGLGVAGRDVDLLIAGDDIVSAEDVVFAMGGVALPRAMHPWHRFFILPDPQTGERVALDVVSELIYSRRLQIPSGLETTCLDRRRKDAGVYVLDPTDMFWTVLLHCLLDKDSVTARRRAELEGVVEKVIRPSPGEAFFGELCPPGWSADRALEAVTAHDWDGLAMLGLQMSSRSGPVAQTVSPVGSSLPGEAAPARARRTARVASSLRRIMRLAARAIYPVVWRRAGLGVTPHALDVADAASVDVVVVSLRRRPGTCEVVLLVGDEQKHRLVMSMQEHHYRRAVGGWNRVTHVGLERIRVVSPSQLALSGPAWEDVRLSSSPMPGRIHCRRASTGLSLLVAAMAASGGQLDEVRRGQPSAASRQAWAVAESLATKHELLSQLELLTPDRQGRMNVVGRAGGSRSTGLRNPRVRPVTVSFSGLDGAGKTRQIDALAAAAGKHHSVEVLWLPTKVWPEPLLNRLPASFRSRLGPKRSTVLSDPPVSGTSGEQSGPTQKVPTTKGGGSFIDAVRSATWLAVATFAATSIGLSLRRRASKSSADLLVLDRYRLDSLVKLQFWYPDVSEAWLSRVVGALVPAPDVEFLLRVDPTVAYARKPEQWSVRQLSSQARMYDRLAAGALNVVTLDAHEEADDLACEVLSQVRPILDDC